MTFWVYKCNAIEHEYNDHLGDWEYVFGPGRPREWGTTAEVAQLAGLKVGDTVLAYQTNKNELVGLARVDSTKDGVIILRPLRRVGAKIRPLKNKYPEVARISAFQGGPIQTLYSITREEVETLLQAARAGSLRDVDKAKARGRLIFGRIGWMKHYAGPQETDLGPIGGGSFNDEEEGGESFNFLDIGGKVYGYFQPAGEGLNLGRIEPGHEDDSLDGVLVVFVARNPQRGGQVVVGWYENATVYARCPDLSKALRKRRGACPYLCVAPSAQSVLLPEQERLRPVPKGRGGMGQANVAYALDADGTPKDEGWIDDVLAWIDAYQGPNLLGNDMLKAEEELEETLGSAYSPGGTGIQPDAEARKAIEQAAVDAAIAHYEAEGYDVEVRGKPFDLLCTKRSSKLHVEVKGTQGGPTQVMLTRNEVDFAREHADEMALYVYHSIKLEKVGGKYQTSDGQVHLVCPWQIDDDSLQAIHYWYLLSP